MDNPDLIMKQSEHLVNAARYLDAVHNVQVDESNLYLHTEIKKYVDVFDSEQLNKYWKAYLASNGTDLTEIENPKPVAKSNNAEDDDDDEEEYIYYRGIKMLKP